MFVGGCVRDRLLGREPADYDIATTATPDEVMKVCKEAGYHVVPTGLDHGTVTVVVQNKPFEVTTLRKDVATDGRHATVEYGTSFEEDASRRDFTVNALYEDAHGKVYDFYEGRKDLLEGKVLKFVGEPEKRVQEDYLRILRLFRFWAQLPLRPTQDSLDAAMKHLSQIDELSRERVRDETFKLFRQLGNPEILNVLITSRVLEQIFSKVGLEQRDFEQLAELLECSLERRELVFCHTLLKRFDMKKVQVLAKDFRLSNQELHLLELYHEAESRCPAADVKQHQKMAYIDWVVSKLGKDDFLDDFVRFARFSFAKDKNMAVDALVKCEENFSNVRRARLPVSGHQLQDRFGLPPGKELGALLNQLKCDFRDGIWSTADQGMQRASEILVGQ